MNGRSSTLTQALVLRARRNIQTEGNPGAAQVRGTPGLCLNVSERLCVEEQHFRADVEERLFRAALACAFDCGLQPRPALKGIHPPAVAAMNGRSSTLTQALVLRARRNIQTEGNPGADQVRGTPPLCPNVKKRLCVEEHLFRADLEERLCRAALASAFDCELQPPPP